MHSTLIINAQFRESRMLLLKFLLSTSRIADVHAFSVPGYTTIPFRSSHYPQRPQPQLVGIRPFVNSALSSKGDDTVDDLPLTSKSGDFPKIIETNGVPIHLYTDDIDENSLDQLKRLAESPIPTDYVSAMPDVHLGKGVTIGTVFASKDFVCPNAVGVDIGCGMAAIPIDGLYKGQLTPDQLNQIQQQLKEQIPVGNGSDKQYGSALQETKSVLDEITADVEPTQYVRERLMETGVTNQLGTLGGGNHFLELVHEEGTDRVWIMLHSGSRRIGNQVATHYNNIAQNLLEKKGVDTSGLKGLNYMPIESEEGQNYLRDMEWCQRYAFENRRIMKETMIRIVDNVTGKTPTNMAQAVNIHHNYCACEDCGNGRKLWVTRKGATSARLGEMGIIPGSMGTGSFITKGKGNILSWNSASHGAGRKMSRTQAHINISQDEFEESMKGIVCDTVPDVKDEAPQAYKDLSVVMKNQESLTGIVHRLLPLVNVKGIDKTSGKWKRMNRTKEEQINILKKEMVSVKKGIKKCMRKAKQSKSGDRIEQYKAKSRKHEERLAKIDSELEALAQK